MKWEYKKTQRKINEAVRLRDAIKVENYYFAVCISCGKVINLDNNCRSKDYHAGHYFLENKYASVRFNLNNIHGQCSRCNRFLHGNLAEYQIGLIKKIGYKEFIKLNNIRNTIKKYSIAELIGINKLADQLIKKERSRLGLNI